jgi:hypothetical protein
MVYPDLESGGLADGWYSFSWGGAYSLNSTEVPPFHGATDIRAQAGPAGALSLYTVSPFTGAPIASHRVDKSAIALHVAHSAFWCSAGPSDPNGWDAVDFYMRGPDALTVSVFVNPSTSASAIASRVAAGADQPLLSATESSGTGVAALMQSTVLFSQARPSLASVARTDLMSKLRQLTRALQASQGVAAMSAGSPSLAHWTLFRVSLSELACGPWERITWKNTGGSSALFYVDWIRLVKFSPQPASQQPPASSLPPLQQTMQAAPSAQPTRSPPRAAPSPPRAVLSPPPLAPPPVLPPPPYLPPPSLPPEQRAAPSQSAPQPQPRSMPPAGRPASGSAPSSAGGSASIGGAPSGSPPPQPSSSLMDNLQRLMGSSTAVVGNSSSAVASHIDAKGGLLGLIASAGLSLSGTLEGAHASAAGASGGAVGSGAVSGGAQQFTTQLGGTGGAGGSSIAGPGPGYASPNPADDRQVGIPQQGGYAGAGATGVGAGVAGGYAGGASLGTAGYGAGGGVQGGTGAAGVRPISGAAGGAYGDAGGISQGGASLGAAGIAQGGASGGAVVSGSGAGGVGGAVVAGGAGVGLAGGGAGVVSGGAVGVTALPTVVNGGAFTNGVDPGYASGIYGGGSLGATTLPTTASRAVFYGGAYGGYGYVPGRSPVRVYLFSSCVNPSIAEVSTFCWCAVCYADILPSSLGLGQQRLLNNYAVTANAIAAHDIQAAATRAQTIASSQAVASQVNARVVGTVNAVLADIQATAALLFAVQQRTRTQIATTLYGVHNPAFSNLDAAVASGAVVVAG